tara:strand:+ start:78 stop:746 length:669 start_codon:yes stop_codon:yes gene_type:complete
MALTIPNDFTTATAIEASKLQANTEAIKVYLNGSVAAGDIQNNAQWATTKHFMKGLYHPVSNTYEMMSGVFSGPALTDLPTFHPGYAGKFVADFGDSSNAAPGCGISFYLDEDADVMLKVNISPRGLCIDAAGFADYSLDMRLDGVANNYSQCFFTKENDLQPTGGASAGIPGYYRRRQYQVHTIFPVVAAGHHNIQLFARSELRAIPLKFYSYSICAYYRV